MSTAKEHLTKLIENQPDDSSEADIVRELAFDLMVHRGLADSVFARGKTSLDGRIVALAEGHLRIHQCRKSSCG